MSSFVTQLMKFLIPSYVSLANFLVESCDSVPTVSSLINLFYIANAWHQMRVYHLVKMQLKLIHIMIQQGTEQGNICNI